MKNGWIDLDGIDGIIAIVVPLIELAGTLAAVHAVMNARTSQQGAVAWAISLPWGRSNILKNQ